MLQATSWGEAPHDAFFQRQRNPLRRRRNHSDRLRRSIAIAFTIRLAWWIVSFAVPQFVAGIREAHLEQQWDEGQTPFGEAAGPADSNQLWL